jgi:phosphohistidine phosphatase SixA
MNILETLSDRDTHVLLIGHNPTIEEAIEMLTDSSDDKIVMPSCALANLRILIEKWSDLKNSKTKHQAVLKEIIKPK